MDAKLQKHLEERNIDPMSPLGRFLVVRYNVAKDTAMRLIRERQSSTGGQGEELRQATKA